MDLGLGRDALNRLWDAVAERLQRNGLRPVGAVRIDALDHHERRALRSLLDRRVEGMSVQVDLATLDQRLRRAGGGGVVAQAELLRGPLVDRMAARNDKAQVDAETWSAARRSLERSGVADSPWIELWLDAIRSTVHRVPASRRQELLETAIRCIATIAEPRPVPWGRSDLATRVAGDAHALDDGRRLGALVLRALALQRDLPQPRTAADRRDVWRAAGVLCDELSTTALTAGLRPGGDHVPAMVLRARTDAGLETHLTARDLDVLAWRGLDGVPVFVCENPRVVQGALDAGCSSPMVCTQGNPTVVTRQLLGQLVESGASLHYHGDFDWPGIAIANQLWASHGFTPWRFDAAGYSDALRIAAPLAIELPAVGNRPVPAAWDPSLTETMRHAGKVVHEELLLEVLLDDLLPNAPT